jgi:hypothetical protein
MFARLPFSSAPWTASRRRRPQLGSSSTSRIDEATAAVPVVARLALAITADEAVTMLPAGPTGRSSAP